MSRSQRKNAEACKKIGERLIELIEVHLRMTLQEAARKLGYANATTLSAIKKGRALPDPSRLLLLASQFRNKTGRAVDIHWLITGQREPFLEDKEPDRGDKKVGILYRRLTTKKQRALLELLQ